MINIISQINCIYLRVKNMIQSVQNECINKVDDIDVVPCISDISRYELYKSMMKAQEDHLNDLNDTEEIKLEGFIKAYP